MVVPSKDHPDLDHRELVLQNTNTLADHEAMKNQRQTIKQLVRNYSFNVSLKETILKELSFLMMSLHQEDILKQRNVYYLSITQKCLSTVYL